MTSTNKTSNSANANKTSTSTNAFKTPNFVHLHVHSVYSKFDGTCYIPGLFAECERLGMPGFALTDHGTITGLKELFREAKKHPSVKPIAGCEIYLTDHFDHRLKGAVPTPEASLPSSAASANRRCFHLILLAKNAQGYQNLKAIVDASWNEGFYRFRPRISHEFLAAHSDGLICTSACIGGEVAQAVLAAAGAPRRESLEKAAQAIHWYKEVFKDDFYLEIDLHPNTQETRIYPLQKTVAKWLRILGHELGVKTVAANDVHFIAEEEATFHDLMLCEKTHSDPNDPNRFRYTGQEWFKSPEEMEIAGFLHHPDELATTLEILNKVETYEI